MKTRLVVGLAAMGLASTAIVAFAADVVPVIPAPIVITPPPPTPTWTGGYIGGHAGIFRGIGADGTSCEWEEGLQPLFWLLEEPFDDIDEEGAPCFWYLSGGTLEGEADAFPSITEDALNDLNGYLAGVQIGFRKQFGSGPSGFVIGAEVAHSWMSVQDTVAGEFLLTWSGVLPGIGEVVLENVPVAWNGIYELNTLTTATLQVGFGTPRLLVYGEVGLAIGTASFSNNFGFAESDTAHGLVYGGGVEFRIASNVSIFGEYNRVRLNEVQMLGVNADIFPMFVDVDIRANVFKAGFNILFGGN